MKVIKPPDLSRKTLALRRLKDLHPNSPVKNTSFDINGKDINK